MKNVKPAARLHVLLARNASTAVIFRRGPSGQVLLIRWNLDEDTFEFGQWFKGRIYELRCDLSPDGEMLMYFAANWKKPYQSWSAISRPPYLTALALWPKGNAWGGGGHFMKSDQVALNHREYEMSLAEGFSVPKWLTIGQLGEHSGGGEDHPIWPVRLQRDGWKLIAYPEKTKDDHGAKVWIEYDPPYLWQKPHPVWPKKYQMQMSVLGIKERNGPWHIVEHSVTGNDGYLGNIGRSDWADWSPTGDLLFSQSGCLYRLRAIKGKFGPVESSEQVADFSSLEFSACAAPDKALQWPSRKAKTKRK